MLKIHVFFRSVNTNPSLIQGECKIDMIESEDVLTNLTMQLSDVNFVIVILNILLYSKFISTNL